MKNLELKQMEKVNGGVTLEEYCSTLKMLIANPDNNLDPFFYNFFQCSQFEK
ncbi:hypothetical protein [Lutibacter sp.]|uniref:hypothetical protein n=1 Tax=Lutibacter sp. TaxID=1925666 RepID=UPI0025C2AD46|nr:hypothetical protein [Lutibacter sp.]MCF6168565.1 hypothetical protein [Lutibacter sp.]